MLCKKETTNLIPSPWLTATDACKYLSMRRESLDALLNTGEIPSHRRGKTRFVHTSDLDAWMRSLPSGAKVPAALIPHTVAGSPTTTTDAA